MQSAIMLLGYFYPKQLKTYGRRKILHVDVYSSFMHNRQTMEATKISFSR